MQKPVDIAELNQIFSLDEFIGLDNDRRINFKRKLKECILDLQQNCKVKFMNQEDILSVGLKSGNQTALAIKILTEKLSPYNYNTTFNFRDTVIQLRKMLFEEIYRGRNFFYDLGEGTIGLDSNYLCLVLGRKFCLEIIS